MKAKARVYRTVEVKYLQVNAGVRYYEDAIVNGKEDTYGKFIPCKKDNRWMPLIDIDSGVILNWEIGKKAGVYYKVCDDGIYTLLDENKEIIATIEDYVPDMLSPGDTPDGDYIVMNIDENGKIENWKPSLEDFDL
jgi:hypothetical protein